MALQEFDFLQNHEDDEISGDHHLLIQPPPLQFQDPVPPVQRSSQQQRPSHKEDAPDLLRPILTMPPVLLMGGGGGGSGGIIPPSPIVEMPPTPDAQMPMVEYPEEDEDEVQEFIVQQDQIDIEVRLSNQSYKDTKFHFFLTLCVLLLVFYKIITTLGCCFLLVNPPIYSMWRFKSI